MFFGLKEKENYDFDMGKCAFAIDYFNSKDRINDYAKFIIWLGTYFSAKEEVILCDESGNHSLVMSRGISVDDIVKVLE